LPVEYPVSRDSLIESLRKSRSHLLTGTPDYWIEFIVRTALGEDHAVVLAAHNTIVGIARLARGCYELAQEWLANAENGRSTVNRTNRRIRILMRFFSQVHNTL
jgi:hypothetical protein